MENKETERETHRKRERDGGERGRRPPEGVGLVQFPFFFGSSKVVTKSNGQEMTNDKRAHREGGGGNHIY